MEIKRQEDEFKGRAIEREGWVHVVVGSAAGRKSWKRWKVEYFVSGCF